MRPALPRPGLQRPAPRRRARGRAAQAGQALIEFAIVALLIVLLVAGGVELGSAALNSRVMRDAALTGANEWAAAVARYGQASGTLGNSELVLAAACPSASEEAENPDLVALKDPNCAGRPEGLAYASCGLGDHAPDGFAQPSCDDSACSNPDPGLPTPGLAYCDPADAPAASEPVNNYNLSRDLFLFNPLPLDVSNCVPPGGAAPSGTCVNRLFESLPALNQSLRSAYQLRCMDDLQSLETTCGPGAATWLLRLPGRYPTVHPDVLPGDAGVVHVGMLSAPVPDAAASAERQGLQLLNPPLRPTFQLQCMPPNQGFDTAPDCDVNDAGSTGCACDSRDVPAGVCWAAPAASGAPSVPQACQVRVGLRYRHHFYALTGSVGGFFNPYPLSDEALAVLDPGILDRQGRAVGGLGAEFTSKLGPDGVSPVSFRVPSKTFFGCAATRTVPAGSALRADALSCN